MGDPTKLKNTSSLMVEKYVNHLTSGMIIYRVFWTESGLQAREKIIFSQQIERSCNQTDRKYFSNQLCIPLSSDSAYYFGALHVLMNWVTN